MRSAPLPFCAASRLGRALKYLRPVVAVVALACLPGLRAQGQSGTVSDWVAKKPPLERLAWDVSWDLSMAHGYDNDPLLNQNVQYALDSKPEEAAKISLRLLQESRGQGKIPFILLNPDVRPRFRRGLVPVMCIGPLGLFADSQVPAEVQRLLVQSIRELAARRGGYKLDKAPVELGDTAALESLLAKLDAERTAADAKVRADNLAKLSLDQRQSNVFYAFSGQLLTKALGGKKTSSVTYGFNYGWGPESSFTSFRKLAPDWRAKGDITFIYCPADTPKSALQGLPPVARIGAYGIWGAPGESPATVRELEQAILTATKDEEFRETAYLMGVDQIGGAGDLQQLVAATKERPPTGKAAAKSSTPAPKPAVVTTTSAKPPAGSFGAPLPSAGPPAASSAAPPPRLGDSRGPSGFASNNKKLVNLGCIADTRNIERVRKELAAREAARRARLEQEARKKVHLKSYAERMADVQKEKEARARQAREFNAWLRAEQEKTAARQRQAQYLQQQQQAKDNAEVLRSDAIQIHVISENGGPRLEIRNNSNVWLLVEWEYRGYVGPEAKHGTWSTVVASKDTVTVTVPGFSDDDCRRLGYTVTVVNATWRKWN